MTMDTSISQSPNLLVLVFDIHTNSNTNSTNDNSSFTHIIDSLLIFINSFLLLDHENIIAVVSTHPDAPRFLYPCNTQCDSIVSSASSVTSTIKSAILQMSELTQKDNTASLSAALATGLCFIHRHSRAHQSYHSRFLIVSSSSQSSADYVGIMNCVFSAQKINVLIDSIVLHDSDSLVLQQASSLSNGLYCKPSSNAFLSYLMMYFLPCVYMRSLLALPAQSHVDFRATCFCHRQVQSTAWVCPVCLSIFCKPSLLCPICHSRFPKLPQRNTTLLISSGEKQLNA